VFIAICILPLVDVLVLVSVLDGVLLFIAVWVEEDALSALVDGVLVLLAVDDGLAGGGV
jgi:hypothetical protein